MLGIYYENNNKKTGFCCQKIFFLPTLNDENNDDDDTYSYTHTNIECINVVVFVVSTVKTETKTTIYTDNIRKITASNEKKKLGFLLYSMTGATIERNYLISQFDHYRHISMLFFFVSKFFCIK